MPEDSISRLATKIVSKGLEVPAVFFLELHKPFTSLIQTTSIILTPLATPFFGAERIESLGRLLADQNSVERLQVEIEKQAQKSA